MDRLERYVTEMRAFQNDLMQEWQNLSHIHEEDISPAVILDEIGKYGQVYNSFTTDFSMRATDEMLDYFLDDQSRIKHPRSIMLKFVHNMYKLVAREADNKEKTLDYLTRIYDQRNDNDEY